jgi:dolichol kinase
MALAYCFSLLGFMIVELLRAYRVHLFIIDSETLHRFMIAFVDAAPSRNWDQGPFILSHIYLLFGCALPLFMAVMTDTKPTGHVHQWTALSGPLLVGIADAAASIFGRYFGRHCLPGHFKTWEGTLGAAVALTLSVVVISTAWSLTGGAYWLVFGLLGVVFEGFSIQNDNLTVGLFAAILYISRQ